MKKWIALLLVVIMCFALVACGGGEPNTNGHNHAQQGGQAGSGNTDHPFLQFLYGEWEYEGNSRENYPFGKLTVNADGTCIVDGVAGTWKVSNETSNGRLYADVTVGDQLIGTAEITTWAGNYNFYVSNIMVSPGDNWKRNTAVTLDENDIALTTENWQNYFEVITEASNSKNAFGEVETMWITQYLVLKEEYASKILATDVVYELEDTANQYYISVNGVENTYEVGEMVQEGEPSTSDIAKLWCDYETNRYQITLTSNPIEVKANADPDSSNSKMVWLVAGIEDVNMLRIQGNLYIVND